MVNNLGTTPGRSPSDPGLEKPAKVLVADDEEAVRELIVAILDDDERYELLVARDGQEALRMARREKPDLLFLDVMMPKRSGIEVCAELKGDAEMSAIPVIMVTTLSQDSDLVAAIDAGADEYIYKPFHPVQLKTMVDNILARGSDLV
jgi:DNA-binding response OmpR family regulator